MAQIFDISPMLRQEEELPPNDGLHLDLHSGYFPTNHRELKGQVSAAEMLLADVEFDTIVCTGVSGIVFATPLAMSLEKRLLIVRKDNESSHGEYRAEGSLGRRWLFVDDFVSSGDTFRRVVSSVESICEGLWYPKSWGEGRRARIEWDTHCIGMYLYQRDGGFMPREDRPFEAKPGEYTYRKIDWKEIR